MFLEQIFHAIIAFALLTYANACMGGALPPETQSNWSPLASNTFGNSYAAPAVQNEPPSITDKQSDPVKWQPQSQQQQPNPWMNSIFQISSIPVSNVDSNPQAPVFVPPLPPWNLPPQIQYQPYQPPTVQQIPCGQNAVEQFQEATPNIFPAPSIPLFAPQNPLQFAYGNYGGYQSQQQFLPPPALYPGWPQYVLPPTTTISISTEEPNYPTAVGPRDNNLKISKISDENVNEKKPVPPPNTVYNMGGGAFTIHQPAHLIAMSRAISVNDRIAIQTARKEVEMQDAIRTSTNKTLIDDTSKTSETTVEPSKTLSSPEPETLRTETTTASTTTTTTASTTMATTEATETPLIVTSTTTDSAVTASTTEDSEQYGLELSGYGYGGPSVPAWYGSQTKDIHDPTDNYRFRIR